MEMLFDLIQGTQKKITFSLYEDPNDLQVDLTTKTIEIRISDDQRNAILYTYSSTDTNSSITKDTECTHKFFFQTPEAIMADPGEYFLEVKVFETSINFEEYFQYRFIIRESIASLS